MKDIPDKFFNLAIVDPQYGIDIMHKGGMPKHLGFKQYERKDWDMEPPGEEYFQELFRVSENQVIFGGNYFTQYLPARMGWIVWDKGQHGLTMSDGELACTGRTFSSGMFRRTQNQQRDSSTNKFIWCIINNKIRMKKYLVQINWLRKMLNFG